MTQLKEESNQTKRTSFIGTLRSLGGLVAGLVGIFGTEGIFLLAKPLIVKLFGSDFAGIVHAMILGFGAVSLFLFVLQYEVAHISEIGGKLVASIRKVFSLTKTPVDEIIRKERKEYELERFRAELEHQRRLDELRLSLDYEQEAQRLASRSRLVSERLNLDEDSSSEQHKPPMPERLKE